MNIPAKISQLHSFEEGMDSDTSPELFSANRARYMLNCRSFSYGNVGIITNVKGNTLISTPLPAGTNKTIGSYPDEQNNRFFFFVYNSNGYHTIFIYNDITNNVITVFQSQTQSGGNDILTFSADHRILHVDIVQTNLIYWVDNFNKARKFDVDKMMNPMASGYGQTIFEDYITAYKKTCLFAPQCKYITDTTRNSNNLYGNLFKFTVRWRYDNGELSNWCDWSRVPLPDNQSYLGIGNITFDNNCIQVTVETGSILVTKIEIAVKLNNTQLVAGEIQTTDFVICQSLDKAELSIPSDSSYTWNFYNDGSYSSTDQNKINRLYSYLPRVPKCQAFVRNAMTYTNFEEGFAPVPINATVDISYLDLYIPNETVNQLNNPAFTATFLGVNVHDVDHNASSTTRFLIGNDVKKGNIFTLQAVNNISPRPIFQYIATVSDTPTSVAAQFKTYLRTIKSWYTNIYNETVDGSGNVLFDLDITMSFFYVLKFTTSVTRVSYDSLKDSGVSINLIKYGSVRNYAFVYIDDDGRESNAYTSPVCVIRTPFVTEIASYKQPLHTITINHTPPIWAKYWRLVRTPDTPTFIWMLIQQAIDVVTTVDGLYTDLVVGSLFTYQKIHPNTELVYDFTRGDRLRLIADENTHLLYTTYYDTEILSYSPVTTEVINSNILLDGTASVKPDAPVNADYVGKYIQVNGYERLIVSVDTGTNKYNLDEKLVGASTDSPSTAMTFPNYTFVDRRGIIRIKRPEGFTLTTNILVEVYTPQQTEISTDYKLFFDFGKKYEVANWGTANRAHRGDTQDQTSVLPAIVQTTNGDAYIRNREYPTNNSIPGTQVVIDKAVDPNFSDFYASDLHDTGRVYPQDTGIGVKRFGSRVRYSNNYIQDTSINGLNDFDNSSREDYDDPYGMIQLTKFREARLYAYKELKCAYILVNNTLTTGADGNSLLASTEKLLNQMQYFAWEGGIGDNPESWSSNGNYQYLVSARSGVYLRIAGDGADPISVIYFYDKEVRRILGLVQRYGLPVIGGFDREFDEYLTTIEDYIPFLFKGGFDPNIWTTLQDITPDGTVGIILTQPVNGSVTLDASGLFRIEMNTGFIGTDSFTYQLQLPGGALTGIKNECITVVAPPNRLKGYQARESSAECVQSDVEPPPPATSTINVNNTTTDFTIAFVQLTGGPASYPNITTVLPGESREVAILVGAYNVTVKILASTDGGSGVLSIYSAGITTVYPVTHFGLTQTQNSVNTHIIVQLDPA